MLRFVLFVLAVLTVCGAAGCRISEHQFAGCAVVCMGRVKLVTAEVCECQTEDAAAGSIVTPLQREEGTTL